MVWRLVRKEITKEAITLKKLYSKPKILFEDFALNTNVAGSCERVVGTLNQGECGINFNGWMTIFAGDVSGCMIQVEDGTTDYGNDGYCYHVPSEIYSLFNS